jgi:hypothetical protein
MLLECNVKENTLCAQASIGQNGGESINLLIRKLIPQNRIAYRLLKERKDSKKEDKRKDRTRISLEGVTDSKSKAEKGELKKLHYYKGMKIRDRN